MSPDRRLPTRAIVRAQTQKSQIQLQVPTSSLMDLLRALGDFFNYKVGKLSDLPHRAPVRMS